MKKRIALSVVTALGAGLLAAAPASADYTATAVDTVTSTYAAAVTDTDVAFADTFTVAATNTSVVSASTTAAPAIGTLTLTAPTNETANWVAPDFASVTGTTDTAYATNPTTKVWNLSTATTSSTVAVALDNTAAVGTYTATVKFGTVSKTLTITVVDDTTGTGGFIARKTAKPVSGVANTAVVEIAAPDTAGTDTLLTVSGSTVTAWDDGYVAVSTADLANAYAADNAAATNFNVRTIAAGDISVKMFPRVVAGQYSDLAKYSLTFTVAAPDDNVYASARVTGGDTDATQEFAATASATAKDVLTVNQYNAAGEAIADGYAKAVSVTLTGDAGSLDLGTLTTRTTAVVYAAGTDATRDISVYANGTAGTAKVAISVNGVLVHTETYVFTGEVASVTATQSQSVVGVGGTLGTGSLLDHAVAIAVKDAAGNDLSGATIGVTSSNTLVMTEAVSATWLADQKVFAVNATASSSAKIGESATLTYYVLKADGVTKVAAAAITFTVAGAADKVTMALDKASYAPGEKATLTITAKDAAGNAAAPTTVSTFSANLATQGLPTTAQAVRSGVKTITLYAPVTSGTWSLSAYDAKLNAITASAAVAAPVDTNITAMNAKVASTEATVAALQVTVASIIKSLKVQWWLLKKIAVKVGIKLG